MGNAGQALKKDKMIMVNIWGYLFIKNERAVYSPSSIYLLIKQTTRGNMSERESVTPLTLVSLLLPSLFVDLCR